MVAFPSWLRHCAVMFLTVGLVGLGFGCHHHSSDAGGTVTISGTITYTRQNLQHDANGSPTGLSGTTVMPARGVVVRAFQCFDEVDQAGNTVHSWRLSGTTQTDGNGYYVFSGQVYSGYTAFVEVESAYQQSFGNAAMVKIIADSAGINSAVAEPKRPVYVLREDVGGQSFTDPTTTTVAMATQDYSINFNLGASDLWTVTVPNWYLPGSDPTPPTGTVALGSRALAILDSVWQFVYYYGDPTPSQVSGGVLDLHYYPGRTESPRRSFVVYDTTLTPLSYDGTKSHYFGSLAAGPSIDDAFDPGVIYPILARNNLYGQHKTDLFPTGRTDLLLSPDLAVVDGLGDAMAATLLATPFLTDATAATAFAPRDIRVLPTTGAVQPSVALPASVAGAAWAVTLKANGKSSPGTPAEWALINPWVLTRFFTLIYPTVHANVATTKSVRSDIANIYTQLGRLLEDPPAGEPMPLQQIFQPLTLIALGTPYGIDWAGGYDENVGWNTFSTAWGQDPASVATSVTLTMASAQTIQNPDPAVTTVALVYPNNSYLRPFNQSVPAVSDSGEIFNGTLSLTVDHTYQLSITPTTLPVGATIEVVVDGAIRSPYVFGGTNPTSYGVALKGSTGENGNATWHYLRVRLLSSTLQASPITFTLNLQALNLR